MYNANNYGYNPYGTYMPQRPMQQPVPQMEQQMIPNQIAPTNRQLLNGKQVDSVEVVKATDIPLDGSISYFPLVDGSAIVTKQLQFDGTSKITIFKPILEEKEQTKYITPDELKKAIEGVDLSELEDIRDEIKELRQEIKEIRKNKKKEE